MAIEPRRAGSRWALTRAAADRRAPTRAANPRVLREPAANHLVPAADTGRVGVVAGREAAVVVVYNIFVGCKAEEAEGSKAVDSKAADNRVVGSTVADSKTEHSMAALA